MCWRKQCHGPRRLAKHFGSDLLFLFSVRNEKEPVFVLTEKISPIIRAARSFLVALEFFVSSKGARAELLDYILGTMWPSMCGVSELISALQSVWSALPSDLANADGKSAKKKLWSYF
jgi:hypothetical protein